MANLFKSTETNIFNTVGSNIWVGLDGSVSVLATIDLPYDLQTYDIVLNSIELVYHLILLTKMEGFKMAITCKVSNQFVYENTHGEHDLEADVLKAVLLDTSFGSFDPATHSTYSDVSGSEIAAGNGYTQKDKTLMSVTVDEFSGVVTLNANNISWTASGGNIEAASACAIINETHVNDTVLCCIEFGANYQATTGTTLTIDLSSGLIEWEANPE